MEVTKQAFVLVTTSWIIVPLITLVLCNKHRQQKIPSSPLNINDNVDIDSVSGSDSNDNINNNVEINKSILEVLQPSKPPLRRSQWSRRSAISEDFMVYLPESKNDLSVNKNLVTFLQAMECANLISD